jgi:hypothetical protein
MKVALFSTLVVLLSATISPIASGRLIFQDDFESDVKGQPPAKWIGRVEECSMKANSAVTRDGGLYSSITC